MCTARTGQGKEGGAAAQSAVSKQAESAPPLTPTTSPAAPAGALSSSTARSAAAPNSMRLPLVEHADAAQAGLARVQERCDRLIGKLRQVLDHALLQDLRHGLWVAVGRPVRLLQHLIDEAQLLQPLGRPAHRICGDFLFVGALPQDRGA